MTHDGRIYRHIFRPFDAFMGYKKGTFCSCLQMLVYDLQVVLPSYLLRIAQPGTDYMGRELTL